MNIDEEQELIRRIRSGNTNLAAMLFRGSLCSCGLCRTRARGKIFLHTGEMVNYVEGGQWYIENTFLGQSKAVYADYPRRGSTKVEILEVVNELNDLEKLDNEHR